MSCFISFLPFLFNKRKIKTLRSLGLSGLIHSTIFLEFLLVKMLWNDLSQSNKFHEFWRIFSMSQVISQLLDELSWTKEEKSEQKTTVGGLGVFYFICICNNDKKNLFSYVTQGLFQVWLHLFTMFENHQKCLIYNFSDKIRQNEACN